MFDTFGHNSLHSLTTTAYIYSEQGRLSMLLNIQMATIQQKTAKGSKQSFDIFDFVGSGPIAIRF